MNKNIFIALILFTAKRFTIHELGFSEGFW